MNKVLKMVIVLVIALFLVSNFVAATNTNEGNIITLSNNTANNTNTLLNNTNNTSVYNNTNTSGLPKAGTSSTMMIFIVLGIISAIYSFKKISDYKANA